MVPLLLAALLAAPAEGKPLDLREPPFGDADWSWLNGSNSQPASLLTTGPVTFSVLVDAYYGWQFSQPLDHTIFPGTVAPRHDEISVNLASLGVDVTGLDGPIGRFYLQAGSNLETDAGADPTVARGAYLTTRSFAPIQQAAVGWHFHALHGINVEAGILPSYFSVDSYLPQENWNYTRPFVSDFTPYYLTGVRSQFFLSQHAKLELWLVNGWQSFGQWHEGRAGGALFNLRPTDSLTWTSDVYAGRDVQSDAGAVRLYSDHSLQWKFYKGEPGALLQWAAVSAAFDAGYERRANAPSGALLGGVVAQRLQWANGLATTLRLDAFYDETRALLQSLPTGLPLSGGPLTVGGLALTLDYAPSPWFLFRLEYAHREASDPLFSGHRGTTSTPPDLRTRDDRAVLSATLRL